MINNRYFIFLELIKYSNKSFGTLKSFRSMFIQKYQFNEYVNYFFFLFYYDIPLFNLEFSVVLPNRGKMIHTEFRTKRKKKKKYNIAQDYVDWISNKFSIVT